MGEKRHGETEELDSQNSLNRALIGLFHILLDIIFYTYIVKHLSMKYHFWICLKITQKGEEVGKDRHEITKSDRAITVHYC